MNAKPMLFSGDMIRAILDGRKTQTRRIVNLLIGRGRGAITEFGPTDTPGYDWHFRDKRMRWHDITTAQLFDACPYGQPGDLLWVREKWRVGAWRSEPFDLNTRYESMGPIWTKTHRVAIDYLASPELVRTPWIDIGWDHDAQKLIRQSEQDCEAADTPTDDDGAFYWEHGESPCRRRPSIHMPRWASRITLKITDVRVQRIQEISDADALSEGIEAKGFEPAHKYKFCLFHSQELFVDLWDSINGKRGFGWNTNPWVWALTFEVIRENVDTVLSKAA